jgi:ribose transport system substrate-binding protein
LNRQQVTRNKLPGDDRVLQRSWRIGIVLAVIAGCGGGENAPAPSGENDTLRLGAVLPMFSHPFFLAQQQGMQEEADALGVRLDVRDGQDDDQKQIVQVEALLNQKVDALVLCPRDENALVVAVESANRAKIPVITLNRRVAGGEVVTYVGADDAEGGRAQGETLAAALGEAGGKIIYLQGTPGSSPQLSRERGLKEALQAHPEITIAADVFSNFQEDQAKADMAGLVRRFKPGEIRAIVAQADEMALPAAEVARDAGWNNTLVLGFNGNAEAFDAIRAGRLHATILQDAADQGRRAIRAAVAHLKGESVPKEVFTPLPVITTANVDSYNPAY